MSKNEVKTFPVIPAKRWWALRERFKKTTPGTVTPEYLSTVLGMKPTSARANIMPSLKRMGIINDDGKPTDRVKKWRDDGQYRETCKAIIGEVYPQELLDAVPDPVADRAGAETWFGNRTGAGRAAVQKMAACYALLVEADPSKATKRTAGKTREHANAQSRPTPPRRRAKADQTTGAKKDGIHDSGPGVCINLQVHISSDASPDQIDQIFASMAKHIYHRKNPDE